MALSPKQILASLRDRLSRVRSVLGKRKERVAHCKAALETWHDRLDRAVKNGWDAKAAEAVQKIAYWREQLDKAVLGVKEYERREARLQKKIKILNAKIAEAEQGTSGASTPLASWNPNRRPIANWIIPWLEKSKAAGWNGYVASGYRSPAYQCEVCKGVCGNCGGCPGTCAAPGTSNHGETEKPGGAVDVTDYYNFGAIQRRIGSPLHNSLGSRDPVHFSYTGN